jgi:hypothetical protein
VVERFAGKKSKGLRDGRCYARDVDLESSVGDIGADGVASATKRILPRTPDPCDPLPNDGNGVTPAEYRQPV